VSALPSAKVRGGKRWTLAVILCTCRCPTSFLKSHRTGRHLRRKSFSTSRRFENSPALDRHSSPVVRDCQKNGRTLRQQGWSQIRARCSRSLVRSRIFFALLCSVSVLTDVMTSRSASIVLIIPVTSSSRCSSRSISALSRGGNTRPSAVYNRSSRSIRSRGRVGSHRCRRSRAVP
jgi:hypothetical protein